MELFIELTISFKTFNCCKKKWLILLTPNWLISITYTVWLTETQQKIGDYMRVCFPNRVTLDRRIFSNIHRRLRETGTFTAINHLKGATQTTRTPDIEEAVLNCIDLNPHVSTKKIGNQLNISHVLVWRILHDFLLYPFHIQLVQTLLPRDFPSRLNFCRWFLDEIRNYAHFDSEIMFRDEANLSRTAITKFHNNNYWTEENLHLIEESHHQE
ncbi:hypothetical protein HHI36_023953 [Cryptolaemus montrouzieri]|uniref:Transposase n=1 Tax=Cryptolaemus montrouzieri TaxID=559131 RepID=A0ABD2PJQ7_9CUCU